MVASADFPAGLSPRQLRRIHQCSEASSSLVLKLSEGTNPHAVMTSAITVSQDIRNGVFKRQIPSESRIRQAGEVIDEMLKAVEASGLTLNPSIAAGYVLGLFEGLIRETLRGG